MLHKVENRWKKDFFNEDLSREWTTHHMSELVIGIVDNNRHDGKNIDGFQGVHRGLSVGKGNQG